MPPTAYALDDGRKIWVCVELDRWSAWLEGDANSHIVGFPLEAILMEVVGMNPAHEDVPPFVERLAQLVRADWPEPTLPV